MATGTRPEGETLKVESRLIAVGIWSIFERENRGLIATPKSYANTRFTSEKRKRRDPKAHPAGAISILTPSLLMAKKRQKYVGR